MPLLTVGHGPQDRVALGTRLAAAGVTRLVDVRRFPASRTNPDVAREALATWLPAAASTATTAVMCSESVWWRCHRRLIADVAVHTRTTEYRPPRPLVRNPGEICTLALIRAPMGASVQISSPRRPYPM